MGENSVVDSNSYQEVISQLGAYTNKVFESCSNMSSAASACVSVMGDDQAAARSVSALQKSINTINDAVNDIHRIMSSMQQELEDSNRAQSLADF